MTDRIKRNGRDLTEIARYEHPLNLIRLARELDAYSKVRHVPPRQATDVEIAEFRKSDEYRRMTAKTYPSPRRTPPSYRHATWRGTLNVDDNHLEIGICFNVGEEVVRLSLDLVSAWHVSDSLAIALRDHVSRCQSLSSSGISSVEGSIPVSGQSEKPPAKALAADSGE
jgi:hypothetical protein